MLINEVTEQQVDEYRLLRQYNGQRFIKHGDDIRHLIRRVRTPLTDFEVRYRKDDIFYSYYLYDPSTQKCVGLFSIEPLPRLKLPILKPGVRAVTPHIVLDPSIRRQGITTRIYTSFLEGGTWVFVTGLHTASAARLWDSLEQGNIVSFYVNRQTGEPVGDPGRDDVRVLGPRDRFQPQVLAGL
jgi:hypothetical protein